MPKHIFYNEIYANGEFWKMQLVYKIYMYDIYNINMYIKYSL